MARLAGKVALITGAGSGIGRAAAERFACEGARVVVAEIDSSAGHDTTAAIEAAGGQARFVQTDVTQPASVEGAVGVAVEAFGRLDLLYNNAGGTRPGDGLVTEVAFEEFWQTMQRDVFGAWVGCRYAIPAMIANGGGAIINASSMVALFGRPGKNAYTVAKGGIISLTRALAVQHAPDRIRVNAIAPGIVQTERLRRRMTGGHIPQDLVDRHLLGLLEPSDVANAALFLASDEARMITGQIISVDSGATIV